MHCFRDFHRFFQDGKILSSQSQRMKNLQASLWDRAAAVGEQPPVLLAKISSPRTLRDFIVDSSARPVVVVRNNTLDMLVCAIKDCLSPESRGLSYDDRRDGKGRKAWEVWERKHKDRALFANGTNADLCINRRDVSKTEKPLAVIDVRSLSARLRKLRSKWGAEVEASLHDMHSPAGLVSTEALLGHAHSCAAPVVAKSVASWHRVLTAWGVEPSNDAIQRSVLGQCGSRSAPPPHSSSIFNAIEVERAFATDPELAEFRWMWRSATASP